MTARAVALDGLRALTTDELAAHLREQRGQLFQVRLQQTIGQVENHRQIRAIRKEIARTMTVQVEYRLAAERGEAPVAPAAPAHTSRRARAAEAAAAPAPARTRRSRKPAEQTDATDTAELVESTASTAAVESADAHTDTEPVDDEALEAEALAADTTKTTDALEAVSDVDVEVIEPGADTAEDDAAIAGSSVADAPTATIRQQHSDSTGATAAGEDQE
jgi:large subunit ribosomal protein L29